MWIELDPVLTHPGPDQSLRHGVLKVIADLRKLRKSTAKPAKNAEKCLFFSVISAISAVKMSFPENRLDFENTLESPAFRLDKKEHMF